MRRFDQKSLLNRRNLLVGGTVGLACTAAQSVMAQPSTEKKSLASIASQNGIIFGAAAAREIFVDESYRKLYLGETKSITTDYALKFDALRPEEKVFQFEGADALVEFAVAKGLIIRGHTLVWNENSPPWLKNKSKAQITKIMDEHIDKVVLRYKGKIDIWDVVNEPFWPGHNASGGYRQGIWYDVLGKDYIAQAFKRAARVDPGAKLAINEAHTERSDELGLAIRNGLLRLIDEMQNAGIPLHAIGLQGHLQPQFPSNDAGYVKFLEQIAARKLEIHITELDIDDTIYTGSVSVRDKQVAERVYAYLSHVLTVPNVKMISTWQLSDRYSWYNDTEVLRKSGATRAPRPLPFDSDMTKKPMWFAIEKALNGRKKN